MDSRGDRGSQEARSRRKERKPDRRGAWRVIPQRGDRQSEPDRDQTSGGGRAAERPAGQRARFGPNGRRLVTLGPSRAKAPALARAAILQPVEGRAAAGAFGEVEIGEMRRLRFEDIREFACRWPLGDPRSGDFAYCGLTPVEGQSYCAGHCRMAYRPPQARAIARERRRAIGNSWRRVLRAGARASVALRLLEYADQSRSIRARFAPSRGRPDEKGPKPASRAVVST